MIKSVKRIEPSTNEQLIRENILCQFKGKDHFVGKKFSCLNVEILKDKLINEQM